MSFLKGLVDSFGSVFSNSLSSYPNPNSSDSSAMEGGVAGAASATNERVASKLKGYFELAKGEIAKAVRAEEWGLVDDAVAHYNCAQRILAEASSTPVHSFISSSEQEKVKSYRQKISKWKGEVSDRLQVLSKRSGGTSINKRTVAPAQTAAARPTSSSSQYHVKPKTLHPSTSMPATRIQTNNVVRPKPAQGSGGGYDEKLVEMINSVIVDRSPSVKWEDVAGLEKVKKTLMEMVILPTKRRDLFTGLRKPARGLLLFGPPGNGKTMLAKAVASESEATFFNVSASSLTSKWVGEAEKLVRTLFMVAISRQPSVIFMDEIDSIMSTRQANENEASRRLKSEFLIQFDGVTSNPNDLVIVIGATNKPQELDDAVLRRLVKRVYIPLPDLTARRLLLSHKLKGQAFSLPSGDLERLARDTEGYSGSDLQALCEEAAMMPIRELGENILTIKANQVRPLRLEDFQKSMTVIRPSLSKSKWEELEKWNEDFGSGVRKRKNKGGARCSHVCEHITPQNRPAETVCCFDTMNTKSSSSSQTSRGSQISKEKKKQLEVEREKRAAAAEWRMAAAASLGTQGSKGSKGDCCHDSSDANEGGSNDGRRDKGVSGIVVLMIVVVTTLALEFLHCRRRR